MGKVLFSQVCVRPQGVPHLHPSPSVGVPRSWSQVPFPGRGYSYPVPNGGTPIQSLMGVPHSVPSRATLARSGCCTPARTGWEYPIGNGWVSPSPPSGLDGGIPPHRDWMGVPPWETEQQREYLLCGGRYASCSQAGVLSCYHPHPKNEGRYCFQFVSPHLNGWYPVLPMGGYPHPRSGQGYPIPDQDGGVLSCYHPHPKNEVLKTVPHLRSGQEVCPSLVRMGGGGTQISGQDGGTPSCWWGVPPSQVRMMVPTCQQDGVPPISRMGVPPASAGWCTPISRMGVCPPSRSPVRMGGGTPNWNRIVCTCYAVGAAHLLRSRRRTFLL